MVHQFRQAREDLPASLTESEAEVRNKIQEMKILGAKEADVEIKYKRLTQRRGKSYQTKFDNRSDGLVQHSSLRIDRASEQ
jgi:hypothetical protein